MKVIEEVKIMQEKYAANEKLLSEIFGDDPEYKAFVDEVAVMVLFKRFGKQLLRDFEEYCLRDLSALKMISEVHEEGDSDFHVEDGLNMKEYRKVLKMIIQE